MENEDEWYDSGVGEVAEQKRRRVTLERLRVVREEIERAAERRQAVAASRAKRACGKRVMRYVVEEENSTAAEAEDETETSETMGSNVPITQNTRKKNNSGPKFEETLLNILKDDLDEDKHFALSLVPTLQSMTDDEKFQAKIEILQVCRRIKANRQHTQSSVTLPSRNILLQPSTNTFLQPGYYYTGSTPPHIDASRPEYIRQCPSTSSQQPDYTGSTPPHIDASRPEYIRQCPSTSSQNSADSLQSYLSNFTPSPHSPLLDLI
ncbi:hypothetical protein FQR65_LT14321 [Abscondita terminalis]|nr:hypothetical protein FQR65_LT14321 [Abscondita terminalis]